MQLLKTFKSYFTIIFENQKIAIVNEAMIKAKLITLRLEAK